MKRDHGSRAVQHVKNTLATEQFYGALTGASPLPEFMSPENIRRIVGPHRPLVEDAARQVG